MTSSKSTGNNSLRVRCSAQYLAADVDDMRSSDYDATHLVKAVKGLPLNENSWTNVEIGGKLIKITEENKDEAIEWFAEWAAPLVDALSSVNKIIIPIPGSSITQQRPDAFRTALIANAISRKCTTPNCSFVNYPLGEILAELQKRRDKGPKAITCQHDYSQRSSNRRCRSG